jgi:hypothetical protein
MKKHGKKWKMLKYFLNLFSNNLPRRDNKAYAELCSLSDHELNDIGITRGQIDAVARGWTPGKGFK